MGKKLKLIMENVRENKECDRRNQVKELKILILTEKRVKQLMRKLNIFTVENANRVYLYNLSFC